jgi:hypothetical protein
MSKMTVMILVVGALGLAGCATTAARSGSPAAAPTRIVLRPSDEAYRGAMSGLTQAEQAVIKKGLGFSVDTLIVTPTVVGAMPWSHKRPDIPVQVSISDFVRYLDLQPALAGSARVNIATARVYAGLSFSDTNFDPVFRIQMEVESTNAGVINVSGFGGGPVCNRPQDEYPLASEQLTQSAQIAFMKAFLKALLKVNEAVQQG